MNVDAERPCQLDTVVGARIDEDETIGNSGSDIGDGPFEGSFCPVGRHGDDLRHVVPRKRSLGGRCGDTLVQ